MDLPLSDLFRCVIFFTGQPAPAEKIAQAFRLAYLTTKHQQNYREFCVH